MKRAAPQTSLGVLTAATQWLDLLWPILLLLGWERVRIEPGNTALTPLAFDSYPISHSLAMAVAWGALFAGLYFLRTRRTTAAVVVGVAVVSHWVLDWITHRPDLPLFPGYRATVGLGLWNSIPATVIVESAMFVAGVWIYLRTTRARHRMGAINFWAYVVTLAAIYVANLVGPPPPSPRAVAIVTLGLWVLPFWAARIDRQRLAGVEDGLRPPLDPQMRTTGSRPAAPRSRPY
jgi:membrane-bound metal-dependent hydrolase YbcI (DUF457 family)